MASKKSRVGRLRPKLYDLLNGVAKKNQVSQLEAQDLIADFLLQETFKSNKKRKILKELEF